MRKKRLAAVGWPILVCAYLALAVSPVSARVLQSGFGYNNYNFSPVTVTYSWSGHYPGEPDVWLLPDTVTVPAGGSVHLDPPQGFIPTDLVIIKTVLRGQTRGGFTVYDPPSVVQTTKIQIPCAAEGAQVWGFQYFGATDYGPVFANTPMAMSGFDSSGFPDVVAAQTDDSGQPILNTSGGHCFVPTSQRVLEDPATRKVFAQYQPKTTGSICAELTFSSTLSPKLVEQGGKQ